MTVRLSTTVSNIEKFVSNEENVQAILRFFFYYSKKFLKILLLEQQHLILNNFNLSKSVYGKREEERQLW